jgi:hypothetical protein
MSITEYLLEQQLKALCALDEQPSEPSLLREFGARGKRWKFFEQTDEQRRKAIECFINEDADHLCFYRDALYRDDRVMRIHEAMVAGDMAALGRCVNAIFTVELGEAIQEQADKEAQHDDL